MGRLPVIRVFGRLSLFNIYVISTVAVAVLGLLAGQIYSYTLLNFAQIARIHGLLSPQLYMHAFAAQPANSYMRWHAGEAFALQGDNETASKLLFPLIHEQSVSLGESKTIITALSIAGYHEDALSFYLTIPEYPRVAPRVAAILLQEYIRKEKKISLNHRLELLLSQALGLVPAAPEFKLLTEQMLSPNFGKTRMAQNLQSALTWRAGKVAEHVSEGESNSAVEVLRKANQQNIARVLDVPVENFKIGPDLAINGNFEQNFCDRTMQIPVLTISPQPCNLLDWLPSYMTTGNPWNRATFVIGPDSSSPFLGNRAIRIVGLVVERNSDIELARAGVWHSPITLTANTAYLISFVYRTSDVNEFSATLWLSKDPDVLFTGDYSFPPTNGTWKRVNIIGWNHHNTNAVIQPLLRSFSEGSVWFDDFSIHPIWLKTLIKPRKAMIDIRNAEY